MNICGLCPCYVGDDGALLEKGAIFFFVKPRSITWLLPLAGYQLTSAILQTRLMHCRYKETFIDTVECKLSFGTSTSWITFFAFHFVQKVICYKPISKFLKLQTSPRDSSQYNSECQMPYCLPLSVHAVAWFWCSDLCKMFLI